MSYRRQLMIANAGNPFAADESAWVIATSESSKTYSFGLRASSALSVVSIDWGDGNVEAGTVGTTDIKAYEHTYSTANEFRISVKGDYYFISTTRSVAANGQMMRELLHASSGLTAMQMWCYLATIRAFGPHFKLPPNLESMLGFARNARFPAGEAEKYLQIPDSVTSLYQTFSGLSSELDITHILDKWTTKSVSRNLYQAFYRASNPQYIQGTARALWDEGFTVSNTTLAFSGCTSLTNYNDIPASWGGGGA